MITINTSSGKDGHTSIFIQSTKGHIKLLSFVVEGYHNEDELIDMVINKVIGKDKNND